MYVCIEIIKPYNPSIKLWSKLFNVIGIFPFGAGFLSVDFRLTKLKTALYHLSQRETLDILTSGTLLALVEARREEKCTNFWVHKEKTERQVSRKKQSHCHHTIDQSCLFFFFDLQPRSECSAKVLLFPRIDYTEGVDRTFPFFRAIRNGYSQENCAEFLTSKGLFGLHILWAVAIEQSKLQNCMFSPAAVNLNVLLYRRP